MTFYISIFTKIFRLSVCALILTIFLQNNIKVLSTETSNDQQFPTVVREANKSISDLESNDCLHSCKHCFTTILPILASCKNSTSPLCKGLDNSKEISKESSQSVKKYDYIYDFTCWMGVYPGYFRVIADCVITLPVFVKHALFHRAKHVAVIKVTEKFDDHCESIIWMLVKLGIKVTVFKSDLTPSQNGLKLSDANDWLYQQKGSRECITCMRDISLCRFNLPLKTLDPYEKGEIVVIVRVGSDRKYINKNKTMDLSFIDLFRNKFGAKRISLYFGNESQSQVVKLFHNAVTVVGIHGAGFVNALFSNAEKTLILEITPYLGQSNAHMYGGSKRFLFQRYNIEHSYLVKKQMKEKLSFQDSLKRADMILTNETVENVMNIICAFLRMITGNKFQHNC